MRILYVTHYSALYGANIALLNVIVEMQKTNDIELVVLVKEIGQLTEKLDEIGIKYLVQDFYGWMTECNRKITWRDYRNFLRNYYRAKKISKTCSKLEINLVHSNSSVVYIGAIIAHLLRVPHIWQIGEFAEEHYNLKYIFPKFFVKKLYYSANAMINVSQAIYNKFQQQYPRVPKKVIYNGIYHKLDQKTSFNNHGKVNFCYTGLLSHGKNQMEVLRASKELLNNGEKNFLVNFIGNSEDDYDKVLEKYVNENNLGKQVKFWGYQTDVTSILSKMDVGIICSHLEAFGLATVEYMMATMPVIGVNEGGTGEIVIDNITGKLYNSGDYNTLSEHMIAFIINRELISKMGVAGYQRYKTNFDISVQANNVYTLYQQIIETL